MLEDYTVNVVYKNKDLECVNQKNYPFTDYCQEQKLNIMRIISDVENAFYNLQDNKSKNDWDLQTTSSFQRIRHRLLDAANSIERLPNNLQYLGSRIDSAKSSDYIAGIINKFTEKSSDI